MTKTPVDPSVFLFDTNAILEAVRTDTWNAITGGTSVETVAECVDECWRGDRLSTGRITVSESHLQRISAVYAVSEVEVAAVLLRQDGSALDAGERDLFAHALAREDAAAWRLCSPDLASIRFAVACEIGDQLASLEEVQEAVGARPSTPLRHHFTKEWLVRERTKARLGVL